MKTIARFAGVLFAGFFIYYCVRLILPEKWTRKQTISEPTNLVASGSSNVFQFGVQTNIAEWQYVEQAHPRIMLEIRNGHYWIYVKGKWFDVGELDSATNHLTH